MTEFGERWGFTSKGDGGDPLEYIEDEPCRDAARDLCRAISRTRTQVKGVRSMDPDEVARGIVRDLDEKARRHGRAAFVRASDWVSRDSQRHTLRGRGFLNWFESQCTKAGGQLAGEKNGGDGPPVAPGGGGGPPTAP